MPTYDYACERCKHTFEHFQRMSDSRLRKCPACGRLALVRLVGAGAGLIFRGSGFYETDYKRAGSSGARNGKDAGDARGDRAASEGGEAKSGAAPGSESGSQSDSGSKDSKEGPGSKAPSGSKRESGSKEGSGSQEGRASKAGASSGPKRPGRTERER